MCMYVGDLFRRGEETATILRFEGENQGTAVIQLTGPNGTKILRGPYARLYAFAGLIDKDSPVTQANALDDFEDITLAEADRQKG